MTLPAPLLKRSHKWDLLRIPLGGTAGGVQRLTNPRKLHIVLEEGAGALVAITFDDDAPGVAAVNVEVEDGAMLTVVTLNRATEPVSIALDQHGTVGAGASLHWQNVTLGGARVTHLLQSTVSGEGGLSSIDWLFYAKGTEDYDLSARNVFGARDGSGDIVMRGIAECEAHVALSGMIDIGRGGGGTSTYLTQDVLMLDRTAKVDAIPALEIKTNDVRASHSATVTHVSPEDLFYFGARGIDEARAREMFVVGFLRSLVEKIENAAVRSEVFAAVEGKFRGSIKH